MSLNDSGNWTKIVLQMLEKLWGLEQNLFGLSGAPFLNAEGHILRFSSSYWKISIGIDPQH